MKLLIVFTGHMISLLMPYVYFGETYPMHTATEEFLFKTPLNLFFNAPSALMCFSAWTVQNKWHVLCRGLLSGGNSNDCNCYRGFMDCSK